MAKINTPSTKHGNNLETYADGSIVYFYTFQNSTIPEKKRLKRIKEAYNIINQFEKKLDKCDPCNKYFKGLAKGKSFSQVWRDNTIFINYSPSLKSGDYGAISRSRKDICITAWCLDTCNRWMIAATIVHELAHAAGAPGGSSHAAEKAADKCGFKPQYNPNIVGSVYELSQFIQRMA